jgi:serine/threonine protein kinase
MDDLLGKTLGQYHLEALLGSGGMGQVYRGVHQLLKRPAAVKVMLANFATRPQFRARFLQEAQAAAALHHPNIIEIYEFGEQDGILFLVMELVTEGSLGSWLHRRKGQPVPFPLALDLASQVALGLDAAHSRQVIHRDIKPANLLLGRTSSGGNAAHDRYLIKINDFGLARLLDGGIQTITGSPMGTLAYMSPEQCAGSKQLDGRSDLYSLGVVLYEMVTGYLPFQINGLSDAVYKHVHTPPPPPRSLRPGLPPLLEQIILRCLAKQPEERFANAMELANALHHALSQSSRSPVSTLTGSRSLQTVIEVPVKVAERPPVVETLPGSFEVPRVRVLNQTGQTLQVLEVRTTGMTLGREPDNDIVLPSPFISRQHLRIGWDGRQVTATDLGSDNGSVLDEVRLLPDAPQVWHERQMLRVGPFWLRLERASTPSSYNGADQSGIDLSIHETLSLPAANSSLVMKTPSPTLTTAPVSTGAPSVSNERIGLSVTPKTVSITPGQPATVQVNLTNQGILVDWFTVTVEGVPAEWVQGNGLEAQLNPGMQETVELLVNVSRQPDNKAQSYPVVIRARSRQDPQDFSQTNGLWVVEPFQDEALSLEPRRASGWGRAKYQVALRNQSNVDYRYALSGDDDEQKLNYRFEITPLDLKAGQEERVPLRVRTRRRWIGRNQRMPFQVHATSPDKSHTQTIAGEFVNRPLLPAWVLAALALLLVAAGVLTHMPRASANTVHGIIQSIPTVTAKLGATPSPTATPVTNNPAPGSGQPASPNVPNIAGDYKGAFFSTATAAGLQAPKALEIQINQNGATLSGTTNEGGTSYSDTGTVNSKGGIHLVVNTPSKTTDFFGSLVESGHLSGTWGPTGGPSILGIWNANTNSAISGNYTGTYNNAAGLPFGALNIQITQNDTSLSGTTSLSGGGAIATTGTISNNGSLTLAANGSINLSGSVVQPGVLAGTWTGGGNSGTWSVNIDMTIAGTYAATFNPGSQSLQLQITQTGAIISSAIKGAKTTTPNAGSANTDASLQINAREDDGTSYLLNGTVTGAGEISGGYGFYNASGTPTQSGTWDGTLA